MRVSAAKYPINFSVLCLLLSFVSAGFTASVTPTPVAGNASCTGGRYELKIEPVEDGVYSDGTLIVTLDVTNGSFNFTTNIGVDTVIVKGGTVSNVYNYNPEVTSDTGLRAAINPKTGKPYGLSHISFCYDIEPPTPTPTNTATNTPTNTPEPPTNTPTSPPPTVVIETPPPTNTPTPVCVCPPPTNTPCPPTPTKTPTNTPTSPPPTVVIETPPPTNTPTCTPVCPCPSPTSPPPTVVIETPPPTPTNTPTPVPPTATPVPYEGCSPGYWKNHLGSWADTGYSPNQTLESVFDVPNSLGLDNYTLIQALNFTGGTGVTGASRILLRQAVAALLNSADPDVDYPATTQQVIDAVNAALASNNRTTILTLASQLDRLNNLYCPLN